MSVYYPIVNFQEKTKNAKQKLLKLVKERLGEEDDVETLKAQKDKANERHKNLSFQVCNFSSSFSTCIGNITN